MKKRGDLLTDTFGNLSNVQSRNTLGSGELALRPLAPSMLGGVSLFRSVGQALRTHLRTDQKSFYFGQDTQHGTQTSITRSRLSQNAQDHRK